VLFYSLHPENETTLQTKLRLPAPSSEVGKACNDVTTTSTTAVDDDDSTHSSLLAGMIIAHFITIST